MSDFEPEDDIKQFSNKTLRELQEDSMPAVPDEKKELVSTESSEIDIDFEIARSSIKEITGKGSEVLEEMIALAKASDSPRAYEVVCNLINTLVSANKDLLELYEKKQKVKKNMPEEDKPVVNNTQNNYYLSVAELQKEIEANGDSDE